jgi:hypothetical protein
MQFQLTIFFALVFLVLAGNTVLLWAICRSIRSASGAIERNRAHQDHVKMTLRMSIRTAEQVTDRLVLASRRLRTAVDEVDDALGRADNLARYGLARLDFNADRASNALERTTRRFGRGAGETAYRTAAAVQASYALLGLFSRLGGARLGRKLPVMTPVATAMTIIQAVNALGELLGAGRPGRDAGARKI